MTIPMLDTLPEDWQRPPVYARYSVQLGKMLDEKRIAGTHLAPYLRNVDVQWDRVNVTNLPEMDFSGEDREKYALRRGDLLVCEGGEVGRTALWKGELEECYFQKAIHRLRPLTDQDDPRFFRYFMRAAVEAGVFELATASTIQHLTAERLRIVRYPAPALEKQSEIANFLDQEISRIDALLKAKDRLIELSIEKRRALITTAVTRGMRSHSAMRDSGFWWIGQVPAHWHVRRLKFELQRLEQGWSPQCENIPADVGEWGVLKVGCVNAERFDASENKRLPSDMAPIMEYEVRDGDILMSRANTAALVDSAVLVRNPPERLLLCDKLYRLEVRSLNLLPEYLVAYLRSSACRFEYERDASGASNSMQNIGQDTVRDLQIPIPPLEEQREILQLLDVHLKRIDAVHERTSDSITLLKERRTALITAAVTGALPVGTAA